MKIMIVLLIANNLDGLGVESNWNSFEIRSIRFKNLRFDWFEICSIQFDSISSLLHTQSKYVEYKTFSDTSKNEVSVHTKHCTHSIQSDEDHILNQRLEMITI